MSIQKTFDLTQIQTTSLSAPEWWAELDEKGFKHTTQFGWETETKPNLKKDFAGRPLVLLTSNVTRNTANYLFFLDNTYLINMYWNTQDMTILVAGENAEFGELEKQLKETYPRSISTDIDPRVALKFWFSGNDGNAAGFSRLLDVPTWEEIKDNYGGVVKDEMLRLTSEAFRPSHGGQLVLWQGPPGTGKTFAIRALIKEWVKWCDGAYIIDPDHFFNNANYMMQVMLDDNYPYQPALEEYHENDDEDHWSVDDPEDDLILEDEEEKPEKAPNDDFRWKLIILEDSGELLSNDAKQRTGQALSRLLNIADGLIGQGLKVLILITTNEEMDSLHEAISRPGRCASKIVFPRLSKDESNEWLTKHDLEPADKEFSLAELYGKQEGFTKEAEKTQPYQREFGFAAHRPERRAIGFDTGRDKTPAPPVGEPVPEEKDKDVFIPD